MKKRKKVGLVFSIIIGLIVLYACGSHIYNENRINQMSKMTYNQLLSNALKNNDKTIITVGVIQNGDISYTIYGKNAETLLQTEYIYEIGSITKTLTASLLFKAINEGKISLDDTVDQYIELPKKNYYPTIRWLITHTSGYNEQYNDIPWLFKLLFANISGKNPTSGISSEQLIERIGKIELMDKDYNFRYLSFGISVIGIILFEIYKENYSTLIT